MSALIYTPKAFSDDIARVIKSSQNARAVRACLLMTRDREHALNVLKKTVAECDRPLYHFTLARRRRYNPVRFTWELEGNGANDEPELLQYAQNLRGGGVAVLEDCTPALREEGGNPHMRMLLADLLSGETTSEGLVLIFMGSPESERHLPSMLADQFVRLVVPYPRTDELEAIASEEIALTAHRARVEIRGERILHEAPRLAGGIVGLTRSAARDALRDALAPNPSDFDAAFQRLQMRKALQLHHELAMNVLEASEVEEPVGLDYLIEYLSVTRNKMRITGHERAKGVLLIGPPGTGKTMIARAIGRLIDLPVVEFRISSLMNSLLGETERRFAQAFATLEAMSPNVVFIDEIEKAFGDSSERDGGTMMRCTGALLSWLSDNPYPNFIVATSNSLRRMGEIGLTMTRSERFDASFFVDLPNQGSRQRMIERWLSPLMERPEEAAQTLAEATEKFSGADLRSVVKQSLARAEYNRIPLDLEHLRTEVERKRMRAIALYDEFEQLRRWGRMYCDPAGPTDYS